MKLKFTIILFAFIACNTLYLGAQTPEIDRLVEVLQNHHKRDELRVDLLNELASAYIDFNSTKVSENAKNALHLANLLNYEKGKAQAFYQMGQFYYITSNLDSSFYYVEQSFIINKSISNQKGLANNYRLLGQLNYFSGNVEQAMDYLEQAVEINILLNDSVSLVYNYASLGTDYSDIGDNVLALKYEKMALQIARSVKDDKATSYALNNLGVVYGVLSNWTESLDCYQQSMLIDERLKDFQGAAVVASNIAFVLKNQGDYEQGLAFCKKGLEYANQSSNKTALCYNYEYMGHIYRAQGNYDKAWDSFEKTLVLQKEIGNQHGVVIGYRDLADMFLLQKKLDSAIRYYEKAIELSMELSYKRVEATAYFGEAKIYKIKNNTKKALSLSKKANRMAKELSDLDLIKRTSNVMAECYKELGMFEEAYIAHVEYKAISDSLYNAENVKKIANLEYTYKYEKEKQLLKEQQIIKDVKTNEELRKQKVVRNTFIVGFSFMSILLVMIMRFFVQKRKANRVLEQKNSEINRQAEELQIKNKTLIKLSYFKEDMTNMVIHDLKTPLSVILNIHMISNEQRRMEIVKHSGFKMMNLIQNILDVYKYESAEIKLQKEKLDLIKVLNLAIGEVEFMAKQKKLFFDIAIENRIIIDADLNILQRTLVNILSNAVKFSSAESKISIAIKLVNESDLHVSIHNIGSYIPIEKQAKIFEKFGQVEKKKQGKLGSTGLGLTFCRLAIKGHDGKIGVNSDEIEGTTFWLTLPNAIKGEVIPENELNEINNLNLIWLSDSEKQSLKSIYHQLAELNVFDIIAFKEIFEKIELQRIKNEKWIKALQDSIYNCVQSDYNRLVAMIIE